LTDFSERRIHSAKILEGASPDVPKIFGSAEALPSRKTTRHSLFAIRYLPFTIRYSPFAIRCRFGSAGASPSHFIPSRVPRPVLTGGYENKACEAG
jgi:hypothetical protein